MPCHGLGFAPVIGNDARDAAEDATTAGVRVGARVLDLIVRDRVQVLDPVGVSVKVPSHCRRRPTLALGEIQQSVDMPRIGDSNVRQSVGSPTSLLIWASPLQPRRSRCGQSVGIPIWLAMTVRTLRTAARQAAGRRHGDGAL